MLLDAPEAAQINVAGNMYNCRFQGMNLSANDVTSINVGDAVTSLEPGLFPHGLSPLI